MLVLKLIHVSKRGPQVTSLSALAKQWSYTELIKHTTYLALAVKLWGICCKTKPTNDMIYILLKPALVMTIKYSWYHDILHRQPDQLLVNTKATIGIRHGYHRVPQWWKTYGESGHICNTLTGIQCSDRNLLSVKGRKQVSKVNQTLNNLCCLYNMTSFIV